MPDRTETWISACADRLAPLLSIERAEALMLARRAWPSTGHLAPSQAATLLAELMIERLPSAGQPSGPSAKP